MPAFAAYKPPFHSQHCAVPSPLEKTSREERAGHCPINALQVDDIYAAPPSLSETLMDKMQSDISDPALRCAAPTSPAQSGPAGSSPLQPVPAHIRMVPLRRSCLQDAAVFARLCS
jgi:hypothetical protein